MSGEEKDKSSQTEEATPHHLEEARKKGQIPQSKEISHLFAFIALALALGFLGPSIGRDMVKTLRPFIEKPFDLAQDSSALPHLLADVSGHVALIIALPLLMLAIAGLASTGLQTRFHMTSEHLKPKFSKLSPAQGFKRLFGKKALVEFLKSNVKLLITGTIAVLVLWPEFGKLSALTAIPPSELFHEMRDLLLSLLISISIALVIIAGLDYGFQWFQHHKDLRMSKQDIKDEYKKMEGNPEIKSKRRQMQRKISSQRPLQSVPNASLLITNPTHFAVALKWIPEEMDAPVVVAKGQDLIALKMREVAKEHDIPIVEDKPLARALYASLEVEQEIRAEHYAAVAEVIRYVMDRNRGQIGQQR